MVKKYSFYLPCRGRSSGRNNRKNILDIEATVGSKIHLKIESSEIKINVEMNTCQRTRLHSVIYIYTVVIMTKLVQCVVVVLR